MSKVNLFNRESKIENRIAPMLHRPSLLLLVLASWLIALGSPPALQAGRFNKVLSLGDAAPGWKELPAIDGAKHSSDDLRDAKAVVVVFTGLSCPIAARYDARLIELDELCRQRGAVLLAINAMPFEKLDGMRQRASQSGYTFPYLHDARQTTAKAFGAHCTPHAFVIDGEQKIAYMGAIDDNVDPAKVEKAYLKNALLAVLDGKPVPSGETRPRGCPIAYQD